MTCEFVRERITALRIQKGISEYKMSYDLGHSRGYINNISSGRTLPSMSEFLAICDYFEITPAEFFDDKIKNPGSINKICKKLVDVSENDLALIESFIDRFASDR